MTNLTNKKIIKKIEDPSYRPRPLVHVVTSKVVCLKLTMA